MNAARQEYYANYIAHVAKDQRKLFLMIRSLLSETKEVQFPSDIDPNVLAESFGKCFVQNIENIDSRLNDMSPPQLIQMCLLPTSNS